MKPSVFTLRDIQEEERKKLVEKDALDYRKQKTHKFNVYGGVRDVERESKKVPCLLKTQP